MRHRLRKLVPAALFTIACSTSVGCGSAQNSDDSATSGTSAPADAEAATAASGTDDGVIDLDSTQSLSGETLPDGSFVVVSGPNAQRMVEAGATLVDVRTPEEFAEDHIEGAINIPHTEISAQRLTDAGVDQAAVLYCASGRRSGLAFLTLRQQGYTAMVSMGAMSNWPHDDEGSAAPSGSTGEEPEADDSPASEEPSDGAATEAVDATAE